MLVDVRVHRDDRLAGPTRWRMNSEGIVVLPLPSFPTNAIFVFVSVWAPGRYVPGAE